MIKHDCVLITSFSWMIAGAIFLSACSPRPPAAVQPPEVISTGTSVPVPVTGLETDSISPLLTSALLVEYSSAPGPGRLQPVNLVTGTVPSGVEPLPVNEASGFAWSADHKTLVFASRAEKTCSPVCLIVIDLPSWKVARTRIPLDGLGIEGFPAAVISPSGDRVVMAYSSISGKNGVFTANLGDPVSFHQVDLKSDVRKLAFTRDGSHVMVYGSDYSAGAGINPVAQVTLLSADGLQVTWQEQLPEIKDGQYQEDPAQPPEEAAWFQPAVMASPVSDQFLIVHADEEKLTTVDFAARKVSTTAIQDKKSLLDRLMASLAGTAQAKMMNGTMLGGVISPDGKTLFVVGVRMENVLQKNGDREVTREFLGLSVINAASGTRTSHLDTESTTLRIEPNGERLFLNIWKEFQGGSIAVTDVYDIQQGKLVAVQAQRNIVPYRLPVGKTVLLSSGPGAAGSIRLSVLDSDTLQPAQELTGWDGRQVDWLVP